MNSTRLYIYCALLFGLLSCSGETTFTTHEIDGEFTIDIPDYMVEVDLGHPEASFQFGNMEKEVYAIGLRDPNEGFAEVDLEKTIEAYADFNMSLLKDALDDAQIKEGEVEELNGMRSKAYDIRGTFKENGLDIYYNILFYESKEALYYVSSWTIGEREETYKATMNTITHSLKEL